MIRRNKLRINTQPALLGKNLPLVLAPGLHIVRRLRRRRHHLECQLADPHPRVERNREAVEVTDLERDRAGEARIDEPCRGVDDDSKTPEGASTLNPNYKIVWHRDLLLRDAEDELPRLHDERIAVRHRDDTHVLREGLGVLRIEERVPAVLVHFEDVAEPEVHARCVDVREELSLGRLYLHLAGGDGGFDVAIGEDHGDIR